MSISGSSHVPGSCSGITGAGGFTSVTFIMPYNQRVRACYWLELNGVLVYLVGCIVGILKTKWGLSFYEA